MIAKRWLGCAAVLALAASLSAAPTAGAQATPTITWNVADETPGVVLPIVVVGQVDGPSGIRALDVSVNLGLTTAKYTGTGGWFAVVIDGRPTGGGGRIILDVTANLWNDLSLIHI